MLLLFDAIFIANIFSPLGVKLRVGCLQFAVH